MATPTWNQLTFLTANQQTLAASLAAKGNEQTLFLQGKGPKPDMSGFTTSQLKAADLMLRDLGNLIGPARTAIAYGMELRKQETIDAWNAANP